MALAAVSPALALPGGTERLNPGHRAAIESHWLRLGPADRVRRFGFAYTDAQISAAANRIDFARDVALGVFARTGALVAFVHAAPRPGPAPAGLSTVAWDAGYSVEAGWRGTDIDRRLLVAMLTRAHAAADAETLAVSAARGAAMGAVRTALTGAQQASRPEVGAGLVIEAVPAPRTSFALAQ